MATKLYLKLVEKQDGDSVLVIAANDGVLFRGDEDENLACGNCKSVIARGVSTTTIFDRCRPDKRLLAQCKCGAFNLLPSNPVR